MTKTFINLCFLLCGLFICCTLSGSAQNLEVVNTTEYVGSGRYDWTVLIQADESVLNQIDFVEYTLHPSFPNPVQIRNDRETKFALSSNGWGEFNIFVKVVFNNGRVKKIKHWLQLEENTQVTEAVKKQEYGKITTRNEAKKVGNDLWEWTVSIETDPLTLSQIDYVEYILHPTFKDPVQRAYSSSNNFALTARGWGTFGIKINVVFTDRTERYLTHMLKF